MLNNLDFRIKDISLYTYSYIYKNFSILFPFIDNSWYIGQVLSRALCSLWQFEHFGLV